MLRRFGIRADETTVLAALPGAVETGLRSRIGMAPRRIDHQATAHWLAVGRVIALLGDNSCSHEALGNGMTVW
jgi:hypothetical protein